MLIYGAIGVWCVLLLPSAVTFVIPAAVAAGVIHVVRGRPYLAALVFLLIVIAAPLLFWPSISTDVLDDLGSIL
ncbi:hypothetical protein [Nocardioides sp. GXZ039]|uniref:hypothetical protein n=1 Tax=Nocardioides sp. GXZ039 TaxID=3136018 RepID=UPI0030F48849